MPLIISLVPPFVPTNRVYDHEGMTTASMHLTSCPPADFFDLEDADWPADNLPADELPEGFLLAEALFFCFQSAK